MAPCLQRAGARWRGWWVTQSAPNDFAGLHVRAGESVRVGLALFDDALAFETFLRGASWAREVQPALSRWLAAHRRRGG